MMGIGFIGQPIFFGVDRVGPRTDRIALLLSTILVSLQTHRKLLLQALQLGCRTQPVGPTAHGQQVRITRLQACARGSDILCGDVQGRSLLTALPAG